MRRLFIPGIFLAICLSLLAWSLPALAQGTVTVVESQAVADFPNSITFKLKAQSQANITDVRLRYKEDRMTCAPGFNEAILTPGTPRPEVEIAWFWDMRKVGLPPGAQVEYWWRIKEASGQWTETEHRKFTFEDTDYQWQRLESGNMSLMWYRGGQAFAAELMRSAEDALEQLGRDIGVRLGRPTRIYVYEDTTDLKGSQVYAWEGTGGIAFSDYGVVLIPVAPEELSSWGRGVIRHEITHLVIGQATFNCYGVTLPTWLSEGLATYTEGDLRPDLAEALRVGIARDTLFSVKSLSGSFPSDYTQALMAYGQSYSLVKYLIETYGQGKMLAFLESFHTGHNTAQALQAAYGLDVDGLDSRWRAYVGAPPRPSPTPSPTPSPAATLSPTTASPAPAATSPAPTATITAAPTSPSTPTLTPTSAVTATATIATQTPVISTTSLPSATPTLVPAQSPTPTAVTTVSPSDAVTPSPTKKPGGSGCGCSQGGGQASLSLEALALAGLTLGLAIVRWRRKKS